MITIKLSCPEFGEKDTYKLYSRFDFNVLREVLIRFEQAALVSEDYVSMFEQPSTIPIDDLHGGNEDEA